MRHGEQRRGAEPQQVGFEPAAAELFFHQHLVGKHILGGRNAAGRFEADVMAEIEKFLADETSRGAISLYITYSPAGRSRTTSLPF